MEVVFRDTWSVQNLPATQGPASATPRDPVISSDQSISVELLHTYDSYSDAYLL